MTLIFAITNMAKPVIVTMKKIGLGTLAVTIFDIDEVAASNNKIAIDTLLINVG